MPVTFHSLVRKDLETIQDYYETQCGPELADAFYEQFQAKVAEALQNPKRFALHSTQYRRANINRFPYHFLYRETESGIRVLVVRHHSRNPQTGLRRR